MDNKGTFKHITIPSVVGQVQLPDAKPACWTTGDKRVTECGLNTTESLIVLTMEVDQKIKAINDELGAKHLEWLGYLKGEKDKGMFFVVDIVVPEQEVSGGSVDVLTPMADDKIIGTVHLHPWTDASEFSGIDEKYIGGNHPMMILVGLNGKYRGMVKEILPCKASILRDAAVEIMPPFVKGLDEFVAESLKKISVYVAPPVAKAQATEKSVQLSAPAQQRSLDDMTLYCGWCRMEVAPLKRRWVSNLMVCEECFDDAASHAEHIKSIT